MEEKSMKRTIITAALIFACTCLHANDLETSNLLGKVKSVTEQTFNSVERYRIWEKERSFDEAIYTYDQKGNRIEEAYYDSDGSLRSKSIYAYDEKGNCIEWAIYNSDGSLNNKNAYIYEIDPIGNWITKTTLQLTTKFDKTQFEPTEVTVRTITYYP